jgi:hypothetical protein
LVCFSAPITRFPDHRITRILAALCLRPSARDPTPHDVLLKTKTKPQFERPVKSLSTLFFSAFQRSNLAQFQGGFSLFTVRSAEGHKDFPVWLTADCRVLIACFQRPFTAPFFPLRSEFLNLPFVRLRCQEKMGQ